MLLQLQYHLTPNLGQQYTLPLLFKEYLFIDHSLEHECHILYNVQRYISNFAGHIFDFIR